MRLSVAVATGVGVVSCCLQVARADRLDDLLKEQPEIERELARLTNAPPPPPPMISTSSSSSSSVTTAQASDGDSPPCEDVAAPRLGPPPYDTERDLAWIGHVGTRIGSSMIDGVDGGIVSELVVAGGIHLDRLTVLGEYGISLVHHAAGTSGNDATGASPTTSGTAINTDQNTDGVMHRLGVDARYSFARGITSLDTGTSSQWIGEMFIQAGAGYEIIQWDQGGRLVRPDASVAVGMAGAVRSSAHSRHGWFVDFRVQVARRIDRQDAAPTCSAPCTEATPPVAWSDRMYMFETGFTFGR